MSTIEILIVLYLKVGFKATSDVISNVNIDDTPSYLIKCKTLIYISRFVRSNATRNIALALLDVC